MVSLLSIDICHLYMKISEAFPSKYMKAADLQGRTIRAVIDRVDLEDLSGEGKPGETKPVVTLRDRKKQLVLNKTNGMTLAQGLGDDTDTWIGKEIEIFPAQTQLQGRIVDCIRVKLLAVADFDDDIDL